MPGGSAEHDAPGGAPGWDPSFFATSRLYWPLVPAASAFASYAAWPPVSAYDEALAPRAGVHFRVQPPKPRRAKRRGPVDPSSLYDARIAAEGWVPTRTASWHDFFNALVWATFPKSKRVFHERQQKAVAARIGPTSKSLPDRRTREQDGLAILDEGSLLLLAAEERYAALASALSARDVLAVESAARGGLSRGPRVRARALREPARAAGKSDMGDGRPAPLPFPAARRGRGEGRARGRAARRGHRDAGELLGPDGFSQLALRRALVLEAALSEVLPCPPSTFRPSPVISPMSS